MSDIYETCPNCGSDNLENGSFFNTRYTTNVEQATREVQCNDCGTTWTEVFDLSSVEDVCTSNEPKPKEDQ